MWDCGFVVCFLVYPTDGFIGGVVVHSEMISLL